MISNRKNRFQPTPPQSQASANISEFRCLFTLDIRRKTKRWQDGLLRFHLFNKRIVVLDNQRNKIGDTFWKEEQQLGDGDELELERGILVQVGECIFQVQQDREDILKAVQGRAGSSPAGGNAVRSKPSQARARDMGTPSGISSTRAYDHNSESLPKPRPLNELLGSTRGVFGRSIGPKSSATILNRMPSAVVGSVNDMRLDSRSRASNGSTRLENDAESDTLAGHQKGNLRRAPMSKAGSHREPDPPAASLNIPDDQTRSGADNINKSKKRKATIRAEQKSKRAKIVSQEPEVSQGPKKVTPRTVRSASIIEIPSDDGNGRPAKKRKKALGPKTSNASNNSRQRGRKRKETASESVTDRPPDRNSATIRTPEKPPNTIRMPRRKARSKLLCQGLPPDEKSDGIPARTNIESERVGQERSAVSLMEAPAEEVRLAQQRPSQSDEQIVLDEGNQNYSNPDDHLLKQNKADAEFQEDEEPIINPENRPEVIEIISVPSREDDGIQDDLEDDGSHPGLDPESEYERDRSPTPEPAICRNPSSPQSALFLASTPPRSSQSPIAQISSALPCANAIPPIELSPCSVQEIPRPVLQQSNAPQPEESIRLPPPISPSHIPIILPSSPPRLVAEQEREQGNKSWQNTELPQNQLFSVNSVQPPQGETIESESNGVELPRPQVKAALPPSRRSNGTVLIGLTVSTTNNASSRHPISNTTFKPPTRLRSPTRDPTRSGIRNDNTDDDGALDENGRPLPGPPAEIVELACKVGGEFGAWSREAFDLFTWRPPGS